MVLFLEFAFGSFYNLFLCRKTLYLFSLRLFSLSPQAILGLISLDCFFAWLWITFSCFFICLVILDCILDIVDDTLLCKGFCFLPPKSVDFCSSRQFKYQFNQLLNDYLWFMLAWFYALLGQIFGKPTVFSKLF